MIKSSTPQKSHVLIAALLMCPGLELGGLLGGTLSGVLSDSTIKAAKSKPQVGLVGRRVQICMAYTVACIGVLLALKGVPAGKHPANHTAFCQALRSSHEPSDKCLLPNVVLPVRWPYVAFLWCILSVGRRSHHIHTHPFSCTSGCG